MSFEKVMVTGHRPQHMSHEQHAFAKRELDRLAMKLTMEQGMRIAISGMALGADTDWAFSALSMRAHLWAFIPFPQQADRWPASQLDTWNYLRGRASHEVVIAESYSVGALHARNDAMLDAADAVIAVWSPSKTTGGTASCVRKAEARGVPLIVVDLDARTTTVRMPR